MKRRQVFLIVLALVGVAGIVCVGSFATAHRFGAADAAVEQLPLIEPDPNPNIKAPPGYRAYIFRYSKRVIVARAERVYVGDDDMHRPDTLMFEYGTGGVIKSRQPKKPGEVSRVFLPTSFELPENVRNLRAETPPSSVAKRQRPPRITKFDEERPPESAPVGTRAYRGNFRGVVYTGTVTGIIGKPDTGFTFAPGSNVRIRLLRKTDTDTTSHIIVPPGASLPADFIASSLRN